MALKKCPQGNSMRLYSGLSFRNVTPGRKSRSEPGEHMSSCVMGHSSSADGTLSFTGIHLQSSGLPSVFQVIVTTVPRPTFAFLVLIARSACAGWVSVTAAVGSMTNKSGCLQALNARVCSGFHDPSVSSVILTKINNRADTLQSTL